MRLYIDFYHKPDPIPNNSIFKTLTLDNIPIMKLKVLFGRKCTVIQNYFTEYKPLFNISIKRNTHQCYCHE